MRPQQQNRRMRGRGGNNNRKGPNPLTRSYESNGPDVKIRGTAQQVAEKYAALARDAMSAGDRVMAENYLQHAEHYNRIIAAALAQQQQLQQQQQQQRDGIDDFDEIDEESGERADAPQRQPEQPQQPAYQSHGFGPQPVIEGMPSEPGYQSPSAEQPRPNGERNGGTYNGAEGDDGGRRGRRRPRPQRSRPEQGGEFSGPEAEAASPAPQGETTEAPQAPEAAE